MKKSLLIPGFALTFIFASCGNSVQQSALEAKQHTIDSLQAAADKQRAIDSMNQLQTVSQQEMPQQAQPATHTRTIVKERVIEREPANTATTATTTTSPAATNTTATAAPHKKGWSGTAKGAVIGAGVGAITGAMVDGRKGEGAVVGGLLGAGAGAGVGAIIDHKNKKKEANTTNNNSGK